MMHDVMHNVMLTNAGSLLLEMIPEVKQSAPLTL